MENDCQEKEKIGADPVAGEDSNFNPDSDETPGQNIVAPATVPPHREDSITEKTGFLELIYGILFEPVKTFQRLAGELSISRAVMIFSLVKILSVAMIGYTLSSRLLSPGGLTGVDDNAMLQMARSMVPVIIAGALLYEYVKWFVYSGTLHLLSDLAGGSGRAAGVLVATGLASLPALLLLPIQILTAFFSGNPVAELVNFLVLLGSLVWGFILVAIGIRETQRISTGRAVLVSLIPAGIIVLAIVVFAVMFVSLLIPMANMVK